MSSDTEDELNNIVAFPIADETSPKERINFAIENDGRFCLHPGFVVNEHDRVVKCKKCGAIIDAFDLLVKLARKETNLANDVQALRDEERYRRANIQKLIQVERNAKARIRRAGGKANA